MEQAKKTSDVLRDIISKHPSGMIQVSEITQTLHEKGFGLLLFTFSFPLIFPLIPGMSSILSLPLLFFSIQMAMGKQDVLLPQKLAMKSISASLFETTIRKILPWLEKIERFVKPRGDAVFTPLMERFIGLYAFSLAGCIALPLSFVTNIIPAAGISVMALALMQRDQKVFWIGAFIGLIGLIISIIAVYVIAISILFVGENVAG